MYSRKYDQWTRTYTHCVTGHLNYTTVQVPGPHFGTHAYRWGVEMINGIKIAHNDAVLVNDLMTLGQWSSPVIIDFGDRTTGRFGLESARCRICVEVDGQSYKFRQLIHGVIGPELDVSRIVKLSCTYHRRRCTHPWYKHPAFHVPQVFLEFHRKDSNGMTTDVIVDDAVFKQFPSATAARKWLNKLEVQTADKKLLAALGQIKRG